MSTPTITTEQGRSAPVLGRQMAGDRSGVAVLDEDGVVLCTGTHADVFRWMCNHGYVEHCNCELVENRGYQIGYEAF